MQKFWTWIKKNWVLVLSALSAVAGFIVGRKSLQPSESDNDRARELIDQYERELAECRDRIGQLAGRLQQSAERIEQLEFNNEQLTENGRQQQQLIKEQRSSLERMEIQLSDAERTVRIAKQYHADTGSDIAGVEKLTGRLRNTIDSFRTELESIHVPDDLPDGGDPD